MATIKELSDGGPDGTRLGQTSADLVGMLGATPVARQSATLSAAITAGATIVGLSSAFIELYAAMKKFGFVA